MPGISGTRGSMPLHALFVVGDALGELLLAGNLLGEVELAAELRGLLEQGNRMATLGGDCRAGQPGGTAADYGDCLFRGNRQESELRLAPGARVHQARGEASREDMVEARLVAGDADVDARAVPGLGLVGELGVGQHAARKRDHVRIAARNDLLADLWRVDPVRRDERQFYRLAQPPRDPRESAARHGLGNSRDACLVPADAGVHDVRAGRFDGARHGEDLAGVLPALDQLERREAVDDDEVLADRGARAAHDFDTESHAVLQTSAPVVLALVGAQGEELRDQVALGSHDLHPVIPRLSREDRGVRKRFDRGFDLRHSHLAR
jgi:hypothetical protein